MKEDATMTRTLAVVSLIVACSLAVAQAPDLDWNFSPQGPWGSETIRSLVSDGSGLIIAFGWAVNQAYASWVSTVSADGEFQDLVGFPIVLGSEMQQSPDTGYVFSGEHIYQLDASWQIEWELSPGGEDSGNVSTVFVFRDGYYVSGSIAGGAEYFGRISSNGELLWSRVFGEPDWDLVQSAAPIPGDRGVFVAG